MYPNPQQRNRVLPMLMEPRKKRAAVQSDSRYRFLRIRCRYWISFAASVTLTCSGTTFQIWNSISTTSNPIRFSWVSTPAFSGKSAHTLNLISDTTLVDSDNGNKTTMTSVLLGNCSMASILMITGRRIKKTMKMRSWSMRPSESQHHWELGDS